MIRRLKTSITPYYFNLIDRRNKNCPIFKQAIPQAAELAVNKNDLDDPIGDKKHSPLKGIIHRYKNRVLLCPTSRCAVFCRHCFRRRLVGRPEVNLTPAELNKAVAYIQKREEISEVILSGGDPLLLSDNQLENLLKKLKKIKHIRWLRIHTRVLAVLPSRITGRLVDILRSVRPLYLVTQINHPKEITRQLKIAADKLSRAGIMVLNQAVLLKGVNDQTKILENLFNGLLAVGIKPYYLHQCDLVRGGRHFRVSLKKGKKLINELRQKISGLAMPAYILDLPGGYGKIPVDGDYVKSWRGKNIVFTNGRGRTIKYLDV